MYDILKARLNRLSNELTAFAARLVATPSPSLGEAEVAKIVRDEMLRLAYDEVITDDAGNVIGVLYGRDRSRTVLLNSHMDTVPADASSWRSDPFNARVLDGRLLGLGAADCKAGLAAQIYAPILIKRALLPLAGNIVVAATVAEENGRSVGVRELLAKTLPSMELKPDFALLGEPTNLGLYYGHDGWFEVDIVVRGANPFHVDDAANAIRNDLSANRLGSDSAFIRRPTFTNDRDVRCATIRLDRRLSPAENVADVVKGISHAASLVTDTMGEVAVEVLVHEAPQKLYTGQTTMVRHVTHAWSVDPFCFLMTRARQSLAAADCVVRPGRWELGKLGMGTAGGTMVSEFNLPAIGFGPGEELLAHAPDESVPLDSVLTTAFGSAAIAHGLVGVPVCGWTSDDI